jgi:hypothetical protein
MPTSFAHVLYIVDHRKNLMQMQLSTWGQLRRRTTLAAETFHAEKALRSPTLGTEVRGSM